MYTYLKKRQSFAPSFFGLACSISAIFSSLIWFHWVLWYIALLLIASWTPLLTHITRGYARQSRWLALFFIVLIGQTGHFFEHLAQMIQIHLLGWPTSQASGVFGVLNIEWVHFLWNTWILFMVLLFLIPFRQVRVLWLLVALAIWHEAEHVAIMITYLQTHVSGSPGLLSRGGMLGGGLPLIRPDLHFLYVLGEQVLLLAVYMRIAPRFAVRGTSLPFMRIANSRGGVG